MMKRSKRFCRGSFKLGRCVSGGKDDHDKIEEEATENGLGRGISAETKWELRPGGMLVQKRETNLGQRVHGEKMMITIRVSTFSYWKEISIEPTSTFGELKMVLSMVIGLEPKEQRLLFKGKERDDNEYLHMVGVGDKDKVLLLEDPAIKETKLHGIGTTPPPPCRFIRV